MSSLLRKKHSGKIWSFSPINTVIHVAVIDGTQNAPDNKSVTKQYHLVFHLPFAYLRPGATSFCEFKLNDNTIPFLELFCCYLHMVEEIYHKHGEEHMFMILENVRDIHNKCVGIRFHFFVCTTEDKLNEIKKDMIKKNREYIVKQKKRVKKTKLTTHESYKNVTSDYAWSKLASNYLMNTEYMQSTFKALRQVGQNINTFHGVFNMDGNIFNGVFINNRGIKDNANICDLQKNPTNYKKDISIDNSIKKVIVFPVEEDIVRIHPSEVFLKEIFIKQKYLPHYFMEKILLPRLTISGHDSSIISLNPNDNLSVSVFEVPDHFHKYVKMKTDSIVGEEDIHEFLSRIGTQIEPKTDRFDKSITRYMVQDEKEKPEKKNLIKQTVKELFYISELKKKQPVHYELGDGVWFSATNKFSHTSPGFLPWFTDPELMDIDPIEKKALTTKHSLDTLDYLKYEAAVLKKRFKNRYEYQHLVFSKFQSEISNNLYATVSEPFRTILDWGNENKNHHVKRHRYKNWDDPNKDKWKEQNVFTNSMKWKMNFFDNDLQVSTGHATLMLLNYAKYDAYRQVQDLHMNIIFTGEGATSKSFLFEKMKQMSIPGTVIELTYQTTKADAIDEDRNDTITVFNEAPPGLFMKNNHADPTQEAMFKEKLTSQRVSCKTFVKDEETDHRSNRTTISSSIGVHMGATNDDPSDASEAMKTRFYWGQFEKNERKNKSMDVCMQGEKIWSDIGEELLEKRLKDFHVEHYRMCLLFKLMYVNAVVEPTLAASDIVYHEVAKMLRKHKLSTSTRMKERFDIMCRIYTMMNAIDMVFNYEMEHTDTECICSGCTNKAQYNYTNQTAAYCLDHRKKDMVMYRNHYGQDFDLRQMIDVEPYLYCTEEIAVFAFTQISQEVYNPAEKKVLDALFQVWKQRKHSFKTNKNDGYEDLSQKDYNVATMKIDNTRHFIKLISVNIPLNIGRPSEHNIKCIIKDLTTRSMTHTSYTNYTFENDSKAFAKGDRYNTYGKGTTTTDCINILEREVEICTELFKNARIKDSLKSTIKEEAWHKQPDTGNILTKCINNIMHQHTNRKHLIFGLPSYGDNGQMDQPNKFHEMVMEKNNNKTIEVINPLYKSNHDIHQMERVQLFEDEMYEKQFIEMDLNDVACLSHFDRVYKEVEDVDNKRITFWEHYHYDENTFSSIAKPIVTVEKKDNFFKYSGIKRKIQDMRKKQAKKKK